MKPRYLVIFPLVIMLGGTSANAANFYWDADSVTAENQNGSGTWNTVNNNWESASTVGVDAQVVWANSALDTAFLGNATGVGYTNASTGGTLTLGQNITAASLSMSSGQSGSYIIDPGVGPYTLTVASIGNNNTTATLTVNAVVAGTTLSKLNAGKVILTNANTYTGATTVSAGTLAYSNTGSLGTSSNIASNLKLGNGSTLQYTGAAVSTDRLFTINGTLAAHAATLDASGTGAINYNNTGSIAYGTTAQTRTLTLAGTNTGSNALAALISDNGGAAVSVTKSGTGTWVLTGTANNYTGNTTISGGALDVGTISSGALSGSGLLFSGGVLQGNGSFTRGFSGVVTAGAGTLSGLTGGFAAKGAALTVNFGGAGALVQLSSGAFQFGNGFIFGSATADSKVTVINPLDLNNNTRTITVNSGTGGDSAELQGVVSNTGVNALTNVFTKAGTGTLTLSAANTYTGDTKVNGGTLALANNLAIQNSALDTSGAGVVSVTGFTTPTFGGLKGSVNVATVITTGYGSVTSLTLNPGTGATPSYGGVIANGATGMTLTKSGAGTQTLTAANTFTGATTINGGTLALSGSGSLASPTIIVGASTTFDVSAVTGGYTLASTQTLSGTGTVAGAATIAGTLSPGNSPGSLAVGSQTWLNGGDYNWQMLDATDAAGTGYDTISMTGTLDLSSLIAGGFAINLWSLASIGPDVNGNAVFDNTLTQSWALLTASGGISGFDAADFLINIAANNGTGGFSNDLGSGTFSLATSGNSLVLNFTTVPEPSAAILTGALGLTSLLRRRRA